MSQTVAWIESTLIRSRQLGRWLDWAGMDSSTVDGTNVSLADPIRHGLTAMGQAATDPTATGDSDVAALQSASLDGVLDIAQLRLLQQVRLQIVTRGSKCIDLPDGMKFMDLIALLDKTIADLTRRCEDLYGYGLQSLSVGTIDLGISRPSVETYPPGDY